MYLTDLRLKNLKLLRDLRIDFGSAEAPRMWTVLIGENGLCKTAILRAIAVAASGPVRGNQLEDVVSLADRRSPRALMRIEADFIPGPIGHDAREYPGLSSRPVSPPEIRSSITLEPGHQTLTGHSGYYGLGNGPASLVLQSLRRSGGLEELASVFSTGEQAMTLLASVGAPLHRVPPFQDKSSPYEFWRETAGEFAMGLIPGGLEALVAAAAKMYPGNQTFCRLLEAEPGQESLIASNPIEEAASRNLPQWLVAGYGTSRHLPRPLASERPRDPVLGRLAPLFDRGKIIGTGFAALLEDSTVFAEALRTALVASKVLPLVSGLKIQGRNWARSASDLIRESQFTMRPGGTEVDLPATWLSQGYQSTIAWIADIIGQFFFERSEPVAFEEMEGLVLIDEIDLHLHPTWQVTLIPMLKELFPALQFIVTTHSPMILPGVAPQEIVYLGIDDEGSVVVRDTPDSPALMTGTEIYRNFFGIDRLHPAKLGEDLRRYGFLVGSPLRGEREEREMLELRARLAKAGVDPGWEPVATRDSEAT